VTLLGDGARLAVGTLTAIPVAPPRVVDRRTARTAMLLAPLVGLLLGVAAAAVLVVTRYVGGPPESVARTAAGAPQVLAADLLGAVLAVAAIALLTRGLHLDGLADTADGLGSGRAGPDALAVMRRSDIGPMGVVTLVLVLGAQVAALTVAAAAHHGTTSVIVAMGTGRLALVWATARGVPAARSDGLGAVVAGTVPRTAAAGWTLVLACVAAGLAWIDDDRTTALLVLAPLAVLVGSAVAGLLVRRAVRRLGGITGDVLGAAVETATLVALIVLAAS
jgi:adenosylcobinamide-GDP ribazoletransferase